MGGTLGHMRVTLLENLETTLIEFLKDKSFAKFGTSYGEEWLGGTAHPLFFNSRPSSVAQECM